MSPCRIHRLTVWHCEFIICFLCVGSGSAYDRRRPVFRPWKSHLTLPLTNGGSPTIRRDQMFQKLRTILRGEGFRHSVRCLIGAGVLCLLGACHLAAAATLCVKPGGKSGCKSSISAAVAAASAGDTIEVAQGTYKEQVIITKQLSLIAADGSNPTIDANGRSNGIFINGMWAAPNAGVAGVLVSGFTIRNANFEGVLIANGTDITITGNHILDNNRSLDVSGASCPDLPITFETSEQMDCGEGIHLIATDHSLIVRNESENNSGGILITDETGSSHDNVVRENYVHDNPYACGITMASHPPATAVIPTAKVSFGMMHNVISHNRSVHNGLGAPGAGAGVGIFAPGPGSTSTANVVIGNVLEDNGLPGVTMHNHGFSTMAPPVNLNDNVIVGNHISGNKADTADAMTSGPTGINIFSMAPITGTVISQNVFDDEAIDIAFNAPSGQINAHFNDFNNGIGVDNLSTGTVDATENWWNCAGGPEGKRCATTAGSGVVSTPWLTYPFENDDRRY
jgi:nitrous oxidase accessory protein NosD